MPHAHSRAPVLVQNAARGALDVSPEVRGRRKVEVDAETVLDPRHDPIDSRGTPEAYGSRGLCLHPRDLAKHKGQSGLDKGWGRQGRQHAQVSHAKASGRT